MKASEIAQQRAWWLDEPFPHEKAGGAKGFQDEVGVVVKSNSFRWSLW